MDDPKRLRTEEDFIAINRFGNSLATLLERYADGCPDHIVAKALLLSSAKEVEEVYQRVVEKLRRLMGESGS